MLRLSSRCGNGRSIPPIVSNLEDFVCPEEGFLRSSLYPRHGSEDFFGWRTHDVHQIQTKPPAGARN